MQHNFKVVTRWPYPFSDYFRRLFWAFFKHTIWRIFWHRIPVLRMLVLRFFGADVHLSSMAFSTTDILRPWDLHLGVQVTLGSRVRIYNLGHIEIGDNTVISQDVYLCGGTHDYSRSDLQLLRKSIIIGSNVWVCAGAFIGPGVQIGDGAVIGARAVVIHDVTPWTVVAGNPAKFIKNRVLAG